MSHKTLSDWLDFISSTHPSEIDMGLARIKKVYEAMSLSSGKSRVVLVAGTNGKGSTIAMMESALLTLGYRVGVYTSPHILHYNERVRLNGIQATDAQLISAFEKVNRAREALSLTYFEFGTLAAFDILFASQPDVVLLEIGLGGRLDAVNIVEPDISIITSIGLDHMEWLGDSLEKIGAEKAGILRHETLMIAGENMPRSVIRKAEELHCQQLICRTEFDCYKGPKTSSVSLMVAGQPRKFDNFPHPLLPENNILIALQAVCCLWQMLEGEKKAFTDDIYTQVVDAINGVVVPGRLERVEHVSIPATQEVYLDVGHNPHAAVYLNAFLMHHSALGKKIQVVYSALKDKDAPAIVEILAGVVDDWFLAPLEGDRAMPLSMLIDAVKCHATGNVRVCDSVDDAIKNALMLAQQAADKQDTVLTLIFGSFYMVEAAKRFFKSYD